jgi:hypothetical protein
VATEFPRFSRCIGVLKARFAELFAKALIGMAVARRGSECHGRPRDPSSRQRRGIARSVLSAALAESAFVPIDSNDLNLGMTIGRPRLRRLEVICC